MISNIYTPFFAKSPRIAANQHIWTDLIIFKQYSSRTGGIMKMVWLCAYFEEIFREKIPLPNLNKPFNAKNGHNASSKLSNHHQLLMLPPSNGISGRILFQKSYLKEDLVKREHQKFPNQSGVYVFGDNNVDFWRPPGFQQRGMSG